MTEELIEGEAEEIGQELVVAHAATPANLFRTEDPAEVIRKATDVADALKDVLVSKSLIKQIGDHEHVKVEGWTLCGAMLGVFPVCVWTRKLEDGWEARVEARTLAGDLVGAAEAMCSRKEGRWKSADDYAIRSMAQTRATSKALRAPLGFIVQLAGFNPTPAEEMPDDAPRADKRINKPQVPVPTGWAGIQEGMFGDNREEAWVLFSAFAEATSLHLFQTSESAALKGDKKTILWQKAQGAYLWLHENVEQVGPFTIITVEHMERAFASVLDGVVLKVELPEPEPEPEPTPREEMTEEQLAEVDRLLDDSIKGPPA